MAAHEKARYGVEDFRLAVAPVSLSPSLRAWAQAGVTHVLFDAPVSLAAVSAAAAANVRREPPAVPARASAAPTAVSPAPSVVKPAAPAGAAEKPAIAAPPPALAFAPRDTVPADSSLWPEPWSGWAAKIAPAPVLWTYHELGADLTGIGRSAERSAFFRDIIGELRLPKGSSVFWPCAMPVEDSSQNIVLQKNSPIFSCGVTYLSPQILVVFGERALDDMDLSGACAVFRQVMVEGKLLVLLPEIGDLLGGSAQRSSVVSLLRAVFASLRFA